MDCEVGHEALAAAYEAGARWSRGISEREIARLTRERDEAVRERDDLHVDLDAVWELCEPHIASDSDAQDFETVPAIVENVIGVLAAATRRAEEAERVAVWMARWANALDFWSEREFAWTSENDVTYSYRHDGTDESIYRALREASGGDVVEQVQTAVRAAIDDANREIAALDAEMAARRERSEQ